MSTPIKQPPGPEDPRDKAARIFAARGARMTPARAKALLSRIGSDDPPRDGDRLDSAGT